MNLQRKYLAFTIFEYYFVLQLAIQLDSLSIGVGAQIVESKEFLQAKRADKCPDQLPWH